MSITKTMFTAFAVVLLSIFLTPELALSQVTADFGAKVGISYTRLLGDTADEADLEAKTGVTGGAALTLHLNDRFAFQTELLYVRKGGKMTIVGIDQLGFLREITTSWELDYLEMPLLAKYKLPSNGIAQPGFYAGPAIAYSINANKSTKTFDDETETEDFDSVKTTDVGLILGADLHFKLSKGHIVFDFRYEPGLLNVLESPEDGRNNIITLMMGYVY